MDIFLNILIVGTGFFVLISIFLFFTTYLPQKMRSNRLKHIANNFKLSFSSKTSGLKWLIQKNYPYKINIMEGFIGGRSIQIYDFFEQHGPIASGGNVRRSTIFIVDGVQTELQDSTGIPTVVNGPMFSSVASPSKIIDFLAKYDVPRQSV